MLPFWTFKILSHTLHSRDPIWLCSRRKVWFLGPPLLHVIIILRLVKWEELEVRGIGFRGTELGSSTLTVQGEWTDGGWRHAPHIWPPVTRTSQHHGHCGHPLLGGGREAFPVLVRRMSASLGSLHKEKTTLLRSHPKVPPSTGCQKFNNSGKDQRRTHMNYLLLIGEDYKHLHII